MVSVHAHTIVPEHDDTGRLVPAMAVGYAANAMPVRLAIERGQWAAAAALMPREGSSPQVAAIVYWARAVARARDGKPQNAAAELVNIERCREALQAAGNMYWAKQAAILEQEGRARIAFAADDPDDAITLMRTAAEEEDSVEKLPVTPGPIVPAREQLAEMLLASGRGPTRCANSSRSWQPRPDAAARCSERRALGRR